jgi:hypothetical protein
MHAGSFGRESVTPVQRGGCAAIKQVMFRVPPTASGVAGVGCALARGQHTTSMRARGVARSGTIGVKGLGALSDRLPFGSQRWPIDPCPPMREDPMEVTSMLLLTLRGTPTLYYGTDLVLRADEGVIVELTGPPVAI